MEKINERIELLLGVDTRSLGIFRILLGIIILFDLCNRALSMKAHYTDEGIISRQVLKGISENPLLLSLNMVSGEPLWQLVLFVAAGLGAISLIIGYKSQIASIVCLILMLSIHVRNPFINNLGDWFLLHLLYWGSLLPLGTRLSVDSKLNVKACSVPTQIFNIATLGILIQISSLYFFSVFQKISPIWHEEGTAIAYALSLDRFVTPVGEWVLSFPPEVLSFLTYMTLLLERWGALLVFLPIFIVPTRLALVSCFIAFHCGLAVSLNLGIFPFVCMAAWILLLPGVIWDRSSRILSKYISKSDAHNSQLRRDSFAVPNVSSSFLLNSIVSVVLLFSVFSSNLLYSGKMSVVYYEGVYKYIEPLVNSLNLRQRWNMFSPHPPKQDGWILIVGVKEDGTMIDIASDGRRISWERPSDISATYHNQRWRKNLEWVMSKWDPHAKLLGDYYLDHWNKKCGEKENIIGVLVYSMQEFTIEPTRSSPLFRRLLYSSQKP